MDKIAENATQIRKLAERLEELLRPYGIGTRVEGLSHIKELRTLLVETTRLIEKHEETLGRQIVQVSDTQPCLFCNDHYEHASEYARGLRWEPVPKQGYVFVCWECALAFQKMVQSHVEGYTYSFLFSLGKETIALRQRVMEQEKSTIPGVIDVDE